MNKISNKSFRLGDFLMKKVRKSYRAVKTNLRNSRRELSRRRRFKKNKRNQNRLFLNHPKAEHEAIHEQSKKYYNKISVPGKFSIISNTEKVIRFISELKAYFLKRKPVWIDMKGVREIDDSAIIVLLSIMIRFKSQKIDFNGGFPDDPIIQKKFVDSGFFGILFDTKGVKNLDRYDVSKSKSIYTHASKKVDPSLGPTIMARVSTALLGHLAVYKGLQRTLIELMQNSFNHAEPSKEGEKHWWISVNLDESNKLASFSFIDYGIGIFQSLNKKDSLSKWYNWRNIISNIFNPQNDAEILKLILEGKLHKTVTGLDFRGKGLPGIKEAMDRNLISKLFIVTNNVFADVANNKYISLSNNFEGTFVYWEINTSTISSPWTL